MGMLLGCPSNMLQIENNNKIDIRVIKMTNEEKKAKAQAQDSLIQHVFDNLRNLVICATMVLAGGAVIKYSTELSLDSTFNVTIGTLVILAAFCLFSRNMVHGVVKLIRPVKGTRKNWLLIPFGLPLSTCFLFSLFFRHQLMINQSDIFQINVIK